MGGPGSGGYKNKPGDTETHSAWDIIPQDPDGSQVNVVAPCVLRTGSRPDYRS